MTRAGHPRCHECSSAFCKRQVETRIVEAVPVSGMILPISHQLPAALRAIPDEMTHASRLRGWPPRLETSLLCRGQDMGEIEFMYICLSVFFSGSLFDLVEPWLGWPPAQVFDVVSEVDESEKRTEGHLGG
ncbi:uncharacterized protein FRV6_00362 [Fusarium oxysporum]|uniref:Uncharacterized protein n=1 Tax=Fusarium oxysporum TaxID=5507 RepID=A0A2H3SZU8_FUSOX|nr:uncharacterized protein FRV6_00362 [Fusarium oxysporum]